MPARRKGAFGAGEVSQGKGGEWHSRIVEFRQRIVDSGESQTLRWILGGGGIITQMEEGTLESRFSGAILGAAIGDALGHPTEFLSLSQIRAKYGQAGVTGFELFWERDSQRFAPYTDDTQMAEIVLQALVSRAPGATMDEVMSVIAAGFGTWADHPQGGHRAPGNSCLAGSRRLRDGVSRQLSGDPTAGGCGSVMRAYPFGLMFNADPDRAEAWSVEHSRMTHGHPIALAACAAMAVGVALEVSGVASDKVLAEMVSAAARYDETTATMADDAVTAGLGNANPDDVHRRYEGWAAHEAIAAAMFVVARHGSDIRAGLLQGANSEGDSDSIATLAGALLGARLGLEALPHEWVTDVERSGELTSVAKAAVLRFGQD